MPIGHLDVSGPTAFLVSSETVVLLGQTCGPVVLRSRRSYMRQLSATNGVADFTRFRKQFGAQM